MDHYYYLRSNKCSPNKKLNSLFYESKQDRDERIKSYTKEELIERYGNWEHPLFKYMYVNKMINFQYSDTIYYKMIDTYYQMLASFVIILLVYIFFYL